MFSTDTKRKSGTDTTSKGNTLQPLRNQMSYQVVMERLLTESPHLSGVDFKEDIYFNSSEDREFTAAAAAYKPQRTQVKSANVIESFINRLSDAERPTLQNHTQPTPPLKSVPDPKKDHESPVGVDQMSEGEFDFNDVFNY